MNIEFYGIAFLTQLLSWIVVAFIVYRLFKKSKVKLIVWKMVIVFFIGIFSFSINWNYYDTTIKLSILPLGVWILILFKGNSENWAYYRPFAWCGFFANYLFLLVSLITLPLNHAIYPDNQLSSYLSDTDKASLIKLHPSAMDHSLNLKNLQQQIPNMRQEGIFSQEWYNKTVMNVGPKDRKERFPYLLVGTKPRFGSNLQSVIYVEKDGKGLLLSTPQKQLYYRSAVGLFKGADH